MIAGEKGEQLIGRPLPSSQIHEAPTHVLFPSCFGSDISPNQDMMLALLPRGSPFLGRVAPAIVLRSIQFRPEGTADHEDLEYHERRPVQTKVVRKKGFEVI